MKFGKRLQQQIEETLPGWRDNFLSYKRLKKLVNLISSSPPPSHRHCVEAQADFVYLLNHEIDKFNAFFMEKEEDFIIKRKELQQRLQRVIDTWGPNGARPSETNCKEDMAEIRKDIVNFHGEMVLLVNYSNINYTGLAKILKKYDKRTGGLLRLLFIQKVLKQPFFTTEVVSKLIKECESTIAQVFPVDEKEIGRREPTIRVTGEGVFRNTVAALLTMQEIRSGSSTRSQFSLPPLDLTDSEFIRTLQMNSPPIPIPIL